MKYVMKKKYFYPVTETLKVQNLPVEMDASIESSSASKLSQITVSDEYNITSMPKMQ